jgi:uncharacterized membrane protein
VRLFQFAARSADLGFVGVTLGGMLEADQVHGWAVQLQLQHLAIEYNVELGGAVFMGIQAAVFGMVVLVMMVFVFVLVRGNRAGQGQQGKRQGKEQAAHDDLRGLEK